MASNPRRLIFNDYGQAGPDRFYANTPIVALEELPADQYPPHGTIPARATPQVDNLPIRALPDENPLFGASLDWHYRGYSVRPLSSVDRAQQARTQQLAVYSSHDQQYARREPLPGDWSDQPVTRPVEPAAPQAQRRLGLFNVVVALEWYPDEAYMQQLEWAFRRASDFLYDVTDGYLAFGQVVFGGPEWLDCADIQIMASNRMHPRSFVDGLHSEQKYRPIRVGRGVWNKRTRLTIPWDEPEAYRSLVHEWGHYALGLKDEYLNEERVVLADAAAAAAGEDRYFTLVVPDISLPIQSIMAAQQGTSELAGYRRDGQSHRQREWDTLRDHPALQFLQLPPERDPHAGPWRLPLPLPYFHNVLAVPKARQVEEARLRLPEGIVDEHCWVYVVKGPIAEPAQVIAQGTLEARSKSDGFLLLGATEDDTVVLIGNEQGQPGVRVRWDRIGNNVADRRHITQWQEATPDPASPLIDVVSTEFQGRNRVEQRRQPAKVAVRLPAGAAWPDRILIFAPGKGGGQAPRRRGQPASAAPGTATASAAVNARALDGYVFTRWQTGEKLQLMISPFSQGGGPTFGVTVPDNPVNPTSGGSAEGNCLLFFADEGEGRSTGDSDLRVTTTMHRNVPDHLPDLPDGSRAHSYTFGIASNAQLPARLNPTLILFYEPLPEWEQGYLLIYRQEDEQRWVPLPTYVKPDTGIAATPLREPVAGKRLLLPDADLDGEPRVERYRLYWLRQDAQLPQALPILRAVPKRGDAEDTISG